MKYEIIRTDTADSHIKNIILYIAERFGNDVALEKLEELNDCIMSLGDNPYTGIDPGYMTLKRQGYKILITKKDLIFYKIYEEKKQVIIYAVTDQRQDYLSIIKGL